jgi:hypothetical protein
MVEVRPADDVVAAVTTAVDVTACLDDDNADLSTEVEAVGEIVDTDSIVAMQD